MKLLFEPWNLGDAFIAASVARLAPDRFILACNSCWHEALMLASDGSLTLLSLDLPYVWRTEKKFFSLGDAASIRKKNCAVQLCNTEVISIRGDLRDWIAAHRIFMGAKFTFSGWLPFFARKLSLLDLPFRCGRPVRNRYRAWADAAGVQFDSIEKTYLPHTDQQNNSPVIIHVGAQWRSKQYPHVAELAELLRTAGKRVEILAGPNDPLPPKIFAERVQRPQWPELMILLRNASHVITNDSGPMHLAAYLGCRTIALSRCSNIMEWQPPGVTAISSSSAPRGYHPVHGYWSDQVLPDWPTPVEILDRLTST